jgi:hypothetical protein
VTRIFNQDTTEESALTGARSPTSTQFPEQSSLSGASGHVQGPSHMRCGQRRSHIVTLNLPLCIVDNCGLFKIVRLCSHSENVRGMNLRSFLTIQGTIILIVGPEEIWVSYSFIQRRDILKSIFSIGFFKKEISLIMCFRETTLRFPRNSMSKT